MSDSLTDFTIQHRIDAPTSGNGLAPNDDTGWTGIGTVPSAGPFAFTDTVAPTPTFYYRTKEITANGVAIPIGPQLITGSGPGTFKWALTGAAQLFGTVVRTRSSPSGIIGFAGFMENFVNWGDSQRTSHGGFDAMYGKITAAGAILRSAVIGSVNSGEAAEGIVFDSSGNMWVLGHFAGTADFSMGGSSDISNHTLTSSGPSGQVNLFLAAYDTASPPNLIALKGWGPALGVSANDLAIDSNNNLYLAINANGAMSFGGFPSIPIPAGSAIVKLNSSLNAVWASTIGTDSSISSLAVDRDGSVVISGSRFVGQNNAFLSRYDSSGGQAWDRLFTSSSAASANAFSVAIDPITHKIIVCGLYGQGTDFGMTIKDFLGNPNGNPGDPSSASGGNFIACYTSANGPVWARTPNVAGYDQRDESAFSVAIDPSQNIFFCGKCLGGMYFGNPDNQILLGGHASYCASIDINAAPRWGFRSTGATGQNISVSIGQSGAVIVGGQVSNGTMNFDLKNPGNGSVTTSSGVTSPFVASFNR